MIAIARRNGEQVTVIPWPDGVAVVEKGAPVAAYIIPIKAFRTLARFRTGGNDWEVLKPFPSREGA